MPLNKTKYKHIEINEQNVPVIAGTTMKVVELVTGQIAYGWSPEELHFQHPYLSMSQIHSALAYYWDHKEELDADIQRREEYAEKMRQEAGESPLSAKLRAMDLIKRQWK
ncbi:MAG: DUF433 domain-containing protein [Scytonema sp. PMC 1069.18]|nr:DUF433 domain-containing protein [Scytonema sp. PMC 1069.18]MEC4887831.1 DUF433 domain-containing protein [Scytonema sp. PMC 1070.18]